MLYKFVTREIGPAFAMFGQKLFFDDRLRGNARMVRPRHPQGGIALHPAPANQDILKRVIEGVPQMQRRGHIRRRNHNRIGSLGAVRCFIGVKILPLLPQGRGFLFHRL